VNIDHELTPAEFMTVGGNLLAFELRLAFFQESLHAFGAVFGSEQQPKRFALEVQTFIEG
jgi:hypothetical protein